MADSFAWHKQSAYQPEFPDSHFRDRRFKVYRQLEKAIGPVLREGEVSGSVFNEFMIGQADATFLFDEDVQEYLKSRSKCLSWLLSMTDEDIDNAPNRAELIDTKSKYFSEIVAFYDTAPRLFAPYIKLTQKNTPFWRPWS